MEATVPSKELNEDKAKRLERENILLHEKLSAYSSRITGLEAKLKDQSPDSSTNEKRLLSLIAVIEERIAALSDDLKAANEEHAAAGERQDSRIAALKAVINEQERTIEMQDEVAQKLDKNIIALQKECCQGRLNHQDLSDTHLENTSLHRKLESVNKKNKLMQEMQDKLATQASMLTDEISKLNAENAQLKEEKQKLEDRIKSEVLTLSPTTSLSRCKSADAGSRKRNVQKEVCMKRIQHLKSQLEMERGADQGRSPTPANDRPIKPCDE